jgi:hypothetical protein
MSVIGLHDVKCTLKGANSSLILFIMLSNQLPHDVWDSYQKTFPNKKCGSCRSFVNKQASYASRFTCKLSSHDYFSVEKVFFQGPNKAWHNQPKPKITSSSTRTNKRLNYFSPKGVIMLQQHCTNKKWTKVTSKIVYYYSNKMHRFFCHMLP